MLRPKAKKILLVDDDENLLHNLAAFLESQGFDPVCASGPQDALSAFKENAPDGVVADYRLGNESGLDLVRSIRDKAPEAAVVLMSAYIDEWIEVLAASLRVICLKKPFSGEDVLRAINHGVMEASG